MRYCLPLFILLAITSTIIAQPGSIDSTFAINGKVIANMGFPWFSVTATAVQADGKIVVGGQSRNGTATTSNTDFFLTRFNTDGTLDNSFGTNGLVYTDIGNLTHDEIAEIVVLADGRIIAGGTSRNFSSLAPYISIARYTHEGKRDSTFNGTGVFYGVSFSPIFLEDMEVQPDGKILISGSDNLHHIRVFRINTDGTVDQSFSLQASADLDFYNTSSIAWLPGGKILVAGSIPPYAGISKVFVAQYQSTGSIDSSFGTNGQIRIPFNTEYLGTVEMSVTPDYTRFYLTIAYPGDHTDTGKIDLLRYNINGTRDLTFANSGLLQLTRHSNNFLHRWESPQCVPQPDGKILFVGITPNDKEIKQFSALRFQPDGSTDNSFGINGRIAGVTSGTPHDATVLTLQPDGKIILAGIEIYHGRNMVAVTRVNSNGSYDNTFLQGGIAKIAVGNGTVHDEAGADIHTLSDGKILAAGVAQNGPFKSIVLAKYHNDGLRDTTFGTNGLAFGDFSNMAFYNLDHWGVWIIAMSVDPQGGIYVLSSGFRPFQRRFCLTLSKFTPYGQPDSSFAEYGRKEFNISESQNDFPIGLGVQADGKPVIAGAADDDGSVDTSYFVITRLNQDGTTDMSFGNGGRMRENQFSAREEISRNESKRLCIQPDGKILLSGSVKFGTYRSFTMRRYTTNGFPDSTFNNGGIVITQIEPNLDYSSQAIKMQPDGKILVGGSNIEFSKMCVVRYMSNGLLDFTFGTNGIKVGGSLLGPQRLNDLVVQPDGKILLLGDAYYHETQPYKGYMVVARLLEDGSADASFGSSGTVFITTSPVMGDMAGAMTLATNGRILVCGGTNANWRVDEPGVDFIIYGLKNTLANCTAVAAHAGVDTAICNGNNVMIGTPAVAGISYSWSPSTGLSSTTAAQPIATPIITTPYTLKVMGSSGCIAFDTVLVTVNPLPTRPTVVGAGPTSFCQGGSVQLSTSAIGALQWTKDGSIITGANGPTLIVTASGQYAVKVTNSQQCSNTSAYTNVTVYTIPTAPVITQTDYTLASSSATGNQWYLNDTIIAGATASTHLPLKPGVYKVKVTLNNCESAFSNSINIITTGIVSPELDKRIIVGPNPVIDDLNIRYLGNFTRFEFTILNISDTRIFARGSFTNSLQFDMRRLSAGTYVIKIMNKQNGDQTRRLIIKL